MRKAVKYGFPPESFGIFACMLLICSRFLSGSGLPGVQALNHFIVVVILCLCVHFVRRTAALSHIHVWGDPLLFSVSVFPVFNLCVAALQLILGDKPFFASPIFSTFSILLSLPSFFCLYFLYVYKRLLSVKVFKVCSIMLLCFGGAYTVFRILDRVVYPCLESVGVSVNAVLKATAHTSVTFSMAIYAMSILCFGVMWAVRAKENQDNSK